MNIILQHFHRFSFYAFVFLLPWHTILILREIYYGAEKWQYGTIGIYAADIFIVIWIALSIYLYSDQIIQWVTKHKVLIISILLLDLWIFLSALWSRDPSLALYRAIVLSCAIDMILVLWIIPMQLHMILITLITSACAQALLGIMQFLTQHTYANSLFGLQVHDIVWGGTASLSVDGERWIRAYGGLPHPNILGGLLLIGLLSMITLYISTKNRSPLFTTFGLVASCVLTLGIIVTFSRVIWLATSIGVFVLFYHFMIRGKALVLSSTAIFTTICTTCVIFAIFFGHLFTTRLIHNTHLTHNSLDDRKTYFTHARSLITTRPLFGTGIGNYTNTAYHTFQTSHPMWYFQPVHNAYMLVITELGMIGTGILLCVLYYTIKSHTLTFILIDPWKFTLVLLIFLIAMISLFDHWTWSSHFGIFLCALLIGMLFVKTKNMQ